jgi:starch synthase (maltosyl-transferring)
VDNPHTKAFPFWEWCLSDLRRDHPDLIFLAEAFTRPKVMYRLAKLGFNQSYTYFPWRHGKAEITSYFTELTRPPVSDRTRPIF